MQHELTYHTTGTFIGAWNHGLHERRVIYTALKRLLRAHGFTVEHDPWVKDRWPSLRNDHHLCRRDNLQCTLEIAPAVIKIEFFQDVATEREDGGRWDHDKLEKMPYLIRLAFLATKRKITRLLEERGYVCTDKPEPKTALEFVQQRRASMAATHKDIYTRPILPGDCCDRDGIPFQDGDLLYFYNYAGRIARGRVYYSGGNMWWVVVNQYEHWHAANFDFFRYDPTRDPLKKVNGAARLRKAYEAAIRENDYQTVARIARHLKRCEAR